VSSSEVVWRESGMAGAEFGNREFMELGVVGFSTGGWVAYEHGEGTPS